MRRRFAAVNTDVGCRRTRPRTIPLAMTKISHIYGLPFFSYPGCSAGGCAAGAPVLCQGRFTSCERVLPVTLPRRVQTTGGVTVFWVSPCFGYPRVLGIPLQYDFSVLGIPRYPPPVPKSLVFWVSLTVL